MPVNKKPFLELQLEWLINNEVTDITYCIGHLGDQVVEYISNMTIPSWMKICFSWDGPIKLGTGGAVSRALERIEGKFLVTYGDSYLRADLSELSRSFLESELPALMTVFRNENRFGESNANLVEDRITKYSKNDAESFFDYIDYGILGFEKSHFSQFKDFPNFDLSAAVKAAIDGKGVLGIEIYERFYEIGTIEGIRNLEQFLTNTQ